MAGRASRSPRTVEHTIPIKVGDLHVDRALGALFTTVNRLEAMRTRDVIEFDLVIGTNKVPHGLGRAVAGYTLTPTVASAAFAHAIDRENPRPDLTVWITVIGADQPNATLEVY